MHNSLNAKVIYNAAKMTLVVDSRGPLLFKYNPHDRFRTCFDAGPFMDCRSGELCAPVDGQLILSLLDNIISGCNRVTFKQNLKHLVELLENLTSKLPRSSSLRDGPGMKCGSSPVLDVRGSDDPPAYCACYFDFVASGTTRKAELVSDSETQEISEEPN